MCNYILITRNRLRADWLVSLTLGLRRWKMREWFRRHCFLQTRHSRQNSDWWNLWLGGKVIDTVMTFHKYWFFCPYVNVGAVHTPKSPICENKVFLERWEYYFVEVGIRFGDFESWTRLLLLHRFLPTRFGERQVELVGSQIELGKWSQFGELDFDFWKWSQMLI